MRRVYYKELTPNRRFGVELELSNNLSKTEISDLLVQFECLYGKKKTVKVTPGPEGWAETVKNNYWHVKFDRTCGPEGKSVDNGWEVASYIGQGVEDINHIARAARFLGNHGGQVNNNCGLHVHVETTDYSTGDMGLLLARWIKIEHALLGICPSRRWHNEYCQTMRSRFERKHIKYSQQSPANFWLDMQPTDLGKHSNYEKRYALNTVGFATARVIPDYNRNTVELRLPECLLEENHVRNWTKLIVHFVDATKGGQDAPENLDPCKDIADILHLLGLSGGEDFYFLDQELLSLKMWLLKKLNSCYDYRLSAQAAKHLAFISQI